MKKNLIALLTHLGMLLVMFLIGTPGVMLAAATALADGGNTEPGEGNLLKDDEGMSSVTHADEDGDVDFLQKDIDKKILKIRPMSTPLDQISRYAKNSPSKNLEFKYFSLGTRPIKTTLSAAVTKDGTKQTQTLTVADPSMFSLDDTIRVVGVKATHKPDGSAYNASDPKTPDLVLCVAGLDDGTSKPVVYAVNGDLDSNDQAIIIPSIEDGTTLIRMGKAGAELDVQTGRFVNLPTADVQFCQNFMMQVEQSTFFKMYDKNVEWTFSDLEEDAVYDMRMGMEGSYLFGGRGMVKHARKNGLEQYFTGGIWWMAGKDIEVGHVENVLTGSHTENVVVNEGETNESEEAVTVNDYTPTVVVSDDDLVDIAKDLFVGTGSGNKRKIMFCGSDMLAALSKIKSEKFRLKDTVEKWNLKFKSWDTDFGEILAIHHEFFDLNGMADQALAIDPEYLYKKTFLSLAHNVLDLKKAGIRNTDAVVLQEVSALYLRYPKAHARMQLVAVPEEDEDDNG